MKITWDSNIEIAFRREMDQELIHSFSRILKIIIPFFAAFALVDSFMVPWHTLPVLWAVRSCGLLAMGYGYWRTKRANPPLWISQVIFFSMGIPIIVIGLLTGGYQGSYFFGMSLAILAISQVFPFEPKKNAFCSFGLATVYLLAVAMQARFVFENPVAMINNCAFLLGSSIIAVWGSWISDRLRRESFLRRLEAEAEHRAKDEATEALSARDEFISLASHELKTPITTIKLQQWLMNKYLDKNELGVHRAALKSFIQRNDDQLRRLVGLVDEMLDLIQLTKASMTFEFKAMDIGEVIRSVVEKMLPQFDAVGMKVNLHLQPQVYSKVDQNRIEQVVLHLLANAVKYAPFGTLDVILSSKDGQSVLEIKDHGPGVPHVYREKIFERFERGSADLSVAGLGLGLYIARQITQAHGGTLTVDPNYSAGASFKMVLPLHSGPVKEAFRQESET